MAIGGMHECMQRALEVHMAIGGTQQYSTALGGHQRPSVAIRGNGEAISRHQRPSAAMTFDIRGNQS